MDTRSSAVPTPPRDTILQLLSDRRRRCAVAALADREPPVPLRDLAAAVATRDRGTEPATPSDEVVVALHHVHLPKLDDAGVVDYDADARTVTAARTAPVEAAVRSLEAAD